MSTEEAHLATIRAMGGTAITTQISDTISVSVRMQNGLKCEASGNSFKAALKNLIDCIIEQARVRKEWWIAEYQRVLNLKNAH